MKIPKAINSIKYIRIHLQSNETCTIMQFKDGTVVIKEPEGMVIVEECPDPLSTAIAHVESKGYRRCEESGSSDGL